MLSYILSYLLVHTFNTAQLINSSFPDFIYGTEVLTGYYAALDVTEDWGDYYNYKRPHSAIKYLVHADYYRGNPDDRIAERKEKLVQAVEMR